MKVDLSPPPLERRVMAGLFDGVVLLAVCAAYFLIPVLTLGVTLPMWGVLAAIIGYSVVPLAVFKQTPGMKLFDLELVAKDGHPVNIGDLLFRELLGRGWFPAAFLFNLVFAYVAMLMGYARVAMPVGLQFVFTLASVMAVFVAVLGHLLALGMADRRTIADMMSKSWVVPKQPRPLPDDKEELEDLRAAKRRSVRNVVIAELLILGIGLGAPWVLTRKTESTEQRAARLLKQKLEAQWKANPESDALTNELQRALWALGENDEAARIRAVHADKVNAAREKRLAELLRQLDARPGDEQLFIDALNDLQDRNRLDEAKPRYLKFLAEHPEPEYRAGYASWLGQVGFADEGVEEYRKLVKEAPEFEGINKFFARALVRADRLEEAQVEYQKEVLLDPDDDDAREALEELNQQLGALPKPKIAALQKELKPVVAKRKAAELQQ